MIEKGTLTVRLPDDKHDRKKVWGTGGVEKTPEVLVCPDAPTTIHALQSIAYDHPPTGHRVIGDPVYLQTP